MEENGAQIAFCSSELKGVRTSHYTAESLCISSSCLLSVCTSVSRVGQSVCSSPCAARLSAFLYVCLSVCLSSPSVCLSVFPVCLSVCLNLYLPVIIHHRELGNNAIIPHITNIAIRILIAIIRLSWLVADTTSNNTQTWLRKQRHLLPVKVETFYTSVVGNWIGALILSKHKVVSLGLFRK